MLRKGNRRLRLDAAAKSRWLKKPKEVRSRKVISDFGLALIQNKTQAQIRRGRQQELTLRYNGRILKKVT